MHKNKTAPRKIKLQRKLDRLEKLLSINITLNSTIDLNTLIKFIINTAAELLNCDAVTILLYDEEKASLYFAETNTPNLKTLAETYVPLQGSLAGVIFSENKPLRLNNVEHDPRHFYPAAQHVNYHTHSLLGVPMRIKDRNTGVLEALNKKDGGFTHEDLEMLLVIASQAAVAIQNAQLVKDLGDAYQTTLEGWSSAMDLRDNETHGHSLRVAEMTVELARAMNISPETIAIFRQGALLHDMGKMGIPDRILLKPGPLTDAEWEIMRQHPAYAYKLLSPIAYLRPALDIPYCHHEKWDGSGYPRGLQGEQIPLSARIFAVVDVWDALTTDRPYRETWSREKTRNYMLAQSGKHFDPQVLQTYLSLPHTQD